MARGLGVYYDETGSYFVVLSKSFGKIKVLDIAYSSAKTKNLIAEGRFSNYKNLELGTAITNSDCFSIKLQVPVVKKSLLDVQIKLLAAEQMPFNIKDIALEYQQLTATDCLVCLLSRDALSKIKLAHKKYKKYKIPLRVLVPEYLALYNAITSKPSVQSLDLTDKKYTESFKLIANNITTKTNFTNPLCNLGNKIDIDIVEKYSYQLLVAYGCALQTINDPY